MIVQDNTWFNFSSSAKLPDQTIPSKMKKNTERREQDGMFLKTKDFLCVSQESLGFLLETKRGSELCELWLILGNASLHESRPIRPWFEIDQRDNIGRASINLIESGDQL